MTIVKANPGSKVYALYKGEELLSIGTAREIASEMNVKIDTILFYKQAAYINRLEQELSDTREQLYISNDTLRQIYMFNEREYYMQQLEEDVNE